MFKHRQSCTSQTREAKLYFANTSEKTAVIAMTYVTLTFNFKDFYVRELNLRVFILMEIYAVCPHFDNVTFSKHNTAKSEHWSMEVNCTIRL